MMHKHFIASISPQEDAMKLVEAARQGKKGSSERMLSIEKATIDLKWLYPWLFSDPGISKDKVPAPPPVKEMHHMAKLTNEDIRYIRFMHKSGIRGADIARKFGVSRSHISRIVNLESRYKS